MSKRTIQNPDECFTVRGGTISRRETADQRRPGTGMSLLARLRVQFPDASGRALKQWLADGRVRVDGVVVRDGRAPVAPGQAVALAPHAPPAFPPPLRLVHEDDDLLVIDKPAGLLTIATEQERERTAYRLLWDYLARRSPPRRPFIVHRLDRETSGLLVFATSPAVKRDLQEQFEARRVERGYVAGRRGPRARGPGPAVELARRAGPRPPSSRRSRTTRCWRGGGTPPCWRCASAPGGDTRSGSSSRSSAIRSWATATTEAARSPIRRLCLHATRLGFVHPGTGEPVRFDSAPPDAFDRVD